MAKSKSKNQPRRIWRKVLLAARLSGVETVYRIGTVTKGEGVRYTGALL